MDEKQEQSGYDYVQILLLCVDDSPTQAVANVVGNINGEEFGVSRITANVDHDDGGSRINATLTDLPPAISMISSDYTLLALEKWRVTCFGVSYFVESSFELLEFLLNKFFATKLQYYITRCINSMKCRPNPDSKPNPIPNPNPNPE